MVTSDCGGAVGLVNELVSKIADKLCFNDQPSKVGDCKQLEDKDLESSAVADADVPAQLLDAYPELAPAFRQRVQDCSDANKLIADAISQHRSSSSAPDPSASGVASASPQPPPAATAALLPPAIQGVFVKSKSHSFPSLTKSTRFIRTRCAPQPSSARAGSAAAWLGPKFEAPRAWESGTSCSALKLCTRVSRKMLLFCGASLSWSAMKWWPPSTA